MIGINAQIRSDSGTAEGVGFAIPINSARRSMLQLISTGKVAYAYVGVTTQDVTPAMSRRYGLGASRGALIQAVVADAPAARAGLRGSSNQEVFNGVPINVGGDLIVSFAGRRVERAADIARIVTDNLLPGQTVSVTVLRHGNGKRETGARSPDRAPRQPDPLAQPGLSWRDSGKEAVGVVRVRKLSVERSTTKETMTATATTWVGPCG